jgi:hypothetical protein
MFCIYNVFREGTKVIHVFEHDGGVWFRKYSTTIGTHAVRGEIPADQPVAKHSLDSGGDYPYPLYSSNARTATHDTPRDSECRDSLHSALCRRRLFLRSPGPLHLLPTAHIVPGTGRPHSHQCAVALQFHTLIHEYDVPMGHWHSVGTAFGQPAAVVYHGTVDRGHGLFRHRGRALFESGVSI